MKYPCRREEYTKKVGKMRVDNICEILENDFGFSVQVDPICANDVDIRVYCDGELMAVIEVLNWNQESSFLDRKRKDCIIRNLTKYEAKKVLVCSFLSNLKDYTSEISSHNIYILEIGFQTLSLSYYEWFKLRNRHHDKRPLNEETKRIVQTKLQECFAHVCEEIDYARVYSSERTKIWGDLWIFG